MAKRTSSRILSALLCVLLALPVLPPLAVSAASVGTGTHYSYTTTKGNWEPSNTALPSNVTYGANASRSSALKVNSGYLYLPEGSQYIPSYSMFAYVSYDKTRDDTTQGDDNHWGLPYRAISASDGTVTTYYKVATADLEFELAEMEPLDTTDLGAVNLSIVTAVNPTAYGATGVDYDHQLQVFVSTDGETWLEGSAGVRSSTLLGGGILTGSTEAMFYRVETEDLLSSIDGLNAGDTIQKIKVLPHGTDKRSTTYFHIASLDVNTWADADVFAADIPTDVSYITVGEDTLRAIAVAEADRTANIQWTSSEPIYVETPVGAASSMLGEKGIRTIAAGTYGGPIYKRGTTHTREAVEQAVVDGVYVGGHGVVTDGVLTDNNAIGMDCQTFVYNAISRVSRTNAWSVAASPMATYSSIPAADQLTITDHPAFTDVDIVDNNTSTQMYKNYAAAKAGDLLIVYKADVNNSVHTRLVKSVDTANQEITYIDQSSGDNYKTSAGHTNTTTFAELYSSGYVVVTLDEYAAGKVAAADIEMVLGSTREGVPFQNGSANLAVSSNYRITEYQVKILDSAKNVKFDSGMTLTNGYRTRAFNYSAPEFRQAIACLDAGTYTLALTANSGPYTSTTQTSAYNTVEQTFTVEATPTHEHSCDQGHDSFEDLGEWLPLSRYAYVSDSNIYLESGNYFLDMDVTLLTGALLLNGDVNLCLNGYTLSRSDSTGAWLIKCGEAADVTLNICDCSADQTGTIGNWTSKCDAQTDAAIIVRNGATCNLWSGTLSGIKSSAIVYVASGTTFNMYGGAITGNETLALTTTAGGAIYANGGAVNIQGGTVYGNTVPTGKTQITYTTASASLLTLGKDNGAGYHVHGDCGHGHDTFTDGWDWIPLSSVKGYSGSDAILTAGNYYVDKDFTTADAYRLSGSGNINLCLNGHTLSGADVSRQYLFRSYDSSTAALNICDCSEGETGKITGLSDTSTDVSPTTSAVFVSRASGVINLYAGTVTGNTAAAVVGAVSQFNMYGGKITGNNLRTCVLYTHSATSAITMDGGEITNNTVTGTGTTSGVLYLKIAGDVFTMTGGAIHSNTVGSGNLQTGAGTANVTDGLIYTNAGYHAHDCGNDGHTVTGDWINLNSLVTSGTGSLTLQDANYYLTDDVTVPQLNVQGTVTVCLNGHNIYRTDNTAWIFRFNADSTVFNLCDCVGTGTIGNGWVSKNTANTDAAVIVRDTNTVFNMYGGTFTGSKAITTVLVIGTTNTFNMYGGKIVDNTTVPVTVSSKTYEYGAVHVASGAFNMYGGEISGNEVAGATQVTTTTSGTSNITGGTVTEFVPTHTHSDCTHGHAAIEGEWLPLSSVTTGMTAATAIPAGNYFLDKDITLPAKFLQVADTVNLCLNGRKLKGCANQGYILQLTGGTLNICDCVGTGTIGEGWDGLTNTSVDAFCAIRVGGTSTLNLYAGSLTGVVESHGIVYLNAGGIFNMYGGSITNNNSTLYPAVRMATSTAKFNMTGGTISGNTCAGESNSQVGSPNGLGNITISGGTVVDTHTHGCGHDHISFGTADSWTPLSYVIPSSGNTVLTSGNYYLDRNITLPDGYITIDDGADVKLCLNGYNLKGTAAASYIFFMGSTASSTGNTLSICDCSADQSGTLGNGWTSAVGAEETTNIRHLSVVRIGAASSTGNTLNLYGGSITGVTAGGMIFVNSGNTFNMYGGKIADNTIQGYGGTAVYGRGAVNITGGEISNNTFAVTSQASNRGIVTADGGTITIAAGTFGTPHSNQVIITGTSDNTSITGGKFNKAPKAELVPEGYLVAETGDATYGWAVVPQLITGATTVNGDVISVNFALDTGDLDDDLSKYTVVMSKQFNYTDKDNDAAQAASKVTGTLDELYTPGEGTLPGTITFTNVSAKEMGDAIIVAITDENGDYVTAYTYSVADQYKTILATAEVGSALANFCIDALNYGAAAQARFGYNTGALVNTDVTGTSTTTVGTWNSSLSVSDGHEALYAATVSLKDNLQLNLYFDVDFADVDSVTVTDSTGGALANEVSSLSNSEKAILKVTLTDMAVKDAKELITCTVTLTDSTVITVTDSLEGYVARNSSSKDTAVITALKRYVESAIALLGEV